MPGPALVATGTTDCLFTCRLCSSPAKKLTRKGVRADLSWLQIQFAAHKLGCGNIPPGVAACIPAGVAANLPPGCLAVSQCLILALKLCWEYLQYIVIDRNELFLKCEVYIFPTRLRVFGTSTCWFVPYNMHVNICTYAHTVHHAHGNAFSALHKV